MDEGHKSLGSYSSVRTAPAIIAAASYETVVATLALFTKAVAKTE
jgi:hypothetical protein